MILIHKKSGKKFYIEEVNKDFHTNFGILKKDDLIKSKPGDIIISHIGEEFLVLNDTFIDKIEKIIRKTQTINYKDIGMLISLTGIGSGSNIIEIGTGSGFLTAFLANIVKPFGKVYSYEIREDFYEIAKKNLEKLNLIDYVELKLKNAYEGLDEKDIDVVISDIPEPWNLIDHAYKSLKFGGFFVSFLPNITSVLKLLDNNDKFLFLGVYENITRKWIYKKSNVLRPRNVELVHTEFLVLLRKI